MSKLTIIFTSLLLIAKLECKFLSIRMPDDIHFTNINLFDLTSFWLKDSLANIVMNYNVEIIISNSKQIGFKNKMKLAIGDHDYPQWKLIETIYKDTFEGILLSRQNDQLVIYSLTFEINDPISFSNDIEWSVEIGSLSEYGSIAFSGSTVPFLIRIIKILFRKDLIVEFFRNSFNFLLETYCSYYCIDNININKDQSDLLSHVHYIKKTTTSFEHVTLCFIENIQNSLPDYHKNICYIDDRASLNPSDALRYLKEALKTKSLKDDNIKITNFNPSRIGKDGNPAFTSQVFDVSLTTLNIGIIKPELFIQIFESIISRLLFGLPIYSPIMIHYETSRNGMLDVFYERKLLAISLQRYFEDAFKPPLYNFHDYINGSLSNIKDTIKIEDYQKHILTFNIERSRRFVDILLSLPQVKRILLFYGGFSYETEINAFLMEEGEELSINGMDISDLTNKYRNQAIQEQESENAIINVGIEIVFPDQRGKATGMASINIIRTKSPRIKILTPPMFTLKTFYQWDFLLINSENASVIGEKVINSYESILFLWGSITKQMFISIQRIYMTFTPPQSSPSSSNSIRRGIMQINMNNNDKSDHSKMLKLLFEFDSIFGIQRFRLKHGFKIEIDLDHVRNIDKFTSFIRENFEIKKKLINDKMKKLTFHSTTTTAITTTTTINSSNNNNNGNVLNNNPSLVKFKRHSILKTLVGENHRTVYSLKYSIKKSVHKDLTWKNAINLLIDQSPSNPSIIQAIKRKGNHLFTGNILVFSYRNKKESKRHVNNLKDKKQIIRIGKVENYKGSNYSFLFIQYSINKRLNSGGGDAFQSNNNKTNLKDNNHFQHFTYNPNHIEEIGIIVESIIKHFDMLNFKLKMIGNK